MASPGELESDDDQRDRIADDRSSRFKMPWFLSKTAVISGAVVIAGALVAAIMLPSYLDNDDQVTAASADPQIDARYEAALEDFTSAQHELATARCEAEQASVPAGKLVLDLEQTLGDRDVIAADGVLLGQVQRDELVSAIDAAQQSLDALDFSDEQRALAESEFDERDCSDPEVDPVPAEFAAPSSSDKIEALQERTEQVRTEVSDIEPIGVELDEVTAIVTTLVAPTIAAADTRSPDSYVPEVFWSADPALYDTLAEVNGVMADARAEWDASDSDPEAALRVLRALGAQVKASAAVVESHESAVNEDVVIPEDPVPPFTEDPDNPEDPDPDPPDDPDPTEPTPTDTPTPTDPVDPTEPEALRP